MHVSCWILAWTECSNWFYISRGRIQDKHNLMVEKFMINPLTHALSESRRLLPLYMSIPNCELVWILTDLTIKCWLDWWKKEIGLHPLVDMRGRNRGVSEHSCAENTAVWWIKLVSTFKLVTVGMWRRMNLWTQCPWSCAKYCQRRPRPCSQRCLVPRQLDADALAVPLWLLGQELLGSSGQKLKQVLLHVLTLVPQVQTSAARWDWEPEGCKGKVWRNGEPYGVYV